MTDEPTKDLTDGEKLNAILQRLAEIEERSAKATRPLLDRILKEMVETREMMVARLDRIEAQLKVPTQDVMQVRTDQQRLEDRMDALERRPN